MEQQALTDVNPVPIVFGGLFIGVWLWIVFTEGPAWLLWGLMGLGLGGALYAGRIANPTVRLVIWIALGISAGLILMAAITEAEESLIGALLAFLGAGLIAAGMPVPTQPWQELPEGDASS